MNHIYLKPVKKKTIISKKDITIEDIAILEGEVNLVNQIKKITILQVLQEKNRNYLISAIELVKAIQDHFENVIIHNLGEQETIISYQTKKKQENQFLTMLKVVFICATLLAGGAVAIMTFHTDAALPDVFTQFYVVFLGDNNLQPFLIEIPYAIGLAIGIIVFFNHFSSVKISEDPTPIEVEMRKYEKDVENSIIEALSSERDDNQ